MPPETIRRPSGLKASDEQAGGVAPEGEDLAAGGRVPELDRPVEAGGGDPAAVGAEGDTDHVRGVADQRVEDPAGRRIQDLDRTGRILLAAIGHPDPTCTGPDTGEPLAIRAGHGLGREPKMGTRKAGGIRPRSLPGSIPVNVGSSSPVLGSQPFVVSPVDLASTAAETTRRPSRRIRTGGRPSRYDPVEDDREARPPVPDLHRALHAARGQLAAVGGEGDGLHEVGVAMEHADRAAGGDLPQPDAPVLARRGEGTAVGAEGQVEDESLMAEDRQPLLAGGRVPELDRPVPAAGGQPFPVGAEGDAIDPLGMPPEFVDLRVGHDVPDLDDLRAGDREVPAVAVEGQVVDASLRARERVHFLAGRDLVELDLEGVVAAILAESHGERLAIGAEGDTHGLG